MLQEELKTGTKSSAASVDKMAVKLVSFSFKFSFDYMNKFNKANKNA